MPLPTGIWIFCESVKNIDGPVRIIDADGNSLIVAGNQLAFVDFPIAKGKYESRLAVLGKVIGVRDNHWRVRFRDGQEGNFDAVVGWQLEFPPQSLGEVKVLPADYEADMAA